MYFTHRDDKVLKLTTPYNNFRQFSKDVDTILSKESGIVFQSIQTQTVVVSKMRFEFTESSETNVIDLNMLGYLVYAHQEILRQLTGNHLVGEDHLVGGDQLIAENQIDNPENNNDLTCLVMTHHQAHSNNTESGNIYFEEIYFQFPYMKAPIDHIRDRLLPNLRHFFTETGLCERLNTTPTNTMDQIVCRDIYERRLWPLPGSCIGDQKLTVSVVFDPIKLKDILEGGINCFDPLAYFELFKLPYDMPYDERYSFFFTNLNGFEVIRRDNNPENPIDSTINNTSGNN